MNNNKEITISLNKDETTVIANTDINKLDLMISVAALAEQLDIETFDLLIDKLKGRSKARKKNHFKIIK